MISRMKIITLSRKRNCITTSIIKDISHVTKIVTFFALFLFVTSLAKAQSTDITSAFLEKWSNSEDYLIEVATVMPEEMYDFKPTEKQMTFAEQLRHINGNIMWLGSSYFNIEVVELEESLTKEELIQALKNSFELVGKAVQEMNPADLKTVVSFFSGPKSKLQLLNLMQDHVTHHRGQLIVYLNLCDVAAPTYSGW